MTTWSSWSRTNPTSSGSSSSAYVFERGAHNTLVWAQTAKLVAFDGSPLDHFGHSVAITKDAAIIGAFEDDDLGPESGSAYVYSRLRCEVRLGLEPATLRAGEELRVAIDLLHRRPFTVTVPFLLWVEDGAGRVIVETASPPITMKPGDRLKPRWAVTLPPGIPAATYRVLVGVRRMQQGIAWGLAGVPGGPVTVARGGGRRGMRGNARPTGGEGPPR